MNPTATQNHKAAAPSPIATTLPADIDVVAIRYSLPRTGWAPVTQRDFARRFGFSFATLRDWEQRRRKPEGAARLLLALIAADPVRVEWLIRDAAVKLDGQASQ